MDTKQYDIIIIGAGICGAAIARELSRYNTSLLLLEKENDVAMGASRANSGIIHGGYTAKHGTLKGELSIKGNRMYPELSRELGFPYKQCGSLVLAFTPEEEAVIESLLQNGLSNGVKNLQILNKQEVLSREPKLNHEIKAALYCGETGIASPYEAVIALAENAMANGVNLELNYPVTAIEQRDRDFLVRSGNKQFSAPVVINAAGVNSDRIAALLSQDSYKILPRRGEYLLLKRGAAEGIGSVIFQAPGPMGKGILVSPTTWGNLLIGPNAEDISNRDDTGNSLENLTKVLRQARKSVPDLDSSTAIRFFSGIRPVSDRGDFIIEESSLPGFFSVGGIESPGLTSAPAIAEKIRNLLIHKGYVSSEIKSSFRGRRKAIKVPTPLLPPGKVKESVNLPEGDPDRIVCRCEQVRESEITDALSRGISLTSLDGVKRRTRAGMGPCQGKFCGPRVTSLLIKHNSLKEEDVVMPQEKDPELLKKLRKL